jgi:thymidylate synthase (FAD)
LGHESVIEHEKVSVRIICDRGVSHEIVRHRLAAYSQESTRFCNYSDDRFGNEITVVEPLFFEPGTRNWEIWRDAMLAAEEAYFTLLRNGALPQEARSVLPNSLKTEIVVTYNLREWRHFFRVRTSGRAHPQMREITVPMLKEFKERIPVIFDDIRPE